MKQNHQIFLIIFSLTHLFFIHTSRAQSTFDLPNESFVLKNGLKVILCRDTSLPVIAVNMAYKAGSGNEHLGKSGIANLVGAMMLQGSVHVSRKQFLKGLDECGASFGGSVDVDRINFWSIFPSDCFETALWIESDRSGFTVQSFTQARLDSLKKSVERDRKRQENNVTMNAKRLLYTKLYPTSHPYSWVTSGKPKEVAKLKLSDIQSYCSEFISPDNASLCIGGNFDPALTKELVKKYFEGIPRSSASVQKTQSPFIPVIKSENVVAEEKVQNSKLFFLFHTAPIGAPQEAALHFIARLLVGDRFARLTKTLLMNYKVALDIQVYQSSQLNAGSFWIVVTCKPETQLQLVYDAVMKELDNIATLPIDDEEILSIKNKLRTASLLPLENLGGFGGRVDILNLANLYTGNPDNALNLLRFYDKMSSGAINAAALKFLKADRCITLSVVPEGKAELGLKEKK